MFWLDPIPQVLPEHLYAKQYMRKQRQGPVPDLKILQSGDSYSFIHSWILQSYCIHSFIQPRFLNTF